MENLTTLVYQYNTIKKKERYEQIIRLLFLMDSSEKKVHDMYVALWNIFHFPDIFSYIIIHNDIILRSRYFASLSCEKFIF